ncbi:hypothetical protein [Streptomyces sp. NPDC018584]|uniref:hypothetical protein n=1 Tax=unclassified Streptomyces TaxID=2593676 RepID=UPI003795209F
MLETLKAKARHRRIRNAARDITRAAWLHSRIPDTADPDPAALTALLFGRHQIHIKPDQATAYLDAALAEQGLTRPPTQTT